MKSYQDLNVWQKSMDLVQETYKIVKLLPQNENYALSDQMRRAAVSIPSNIAEGYSRYAAKDYARFLAIARGSKAELETQILICIRLHYINKAQASPALNLCIEVGKMLNSLILKLQ